MLYRTLAALRGEKPISGMSPSRPLSHLYIFDNRIGWARTYLKKAGLIKYTQRGRFQITDRGKEVLAKKPAAINVAYLRQFPEFLEFVAAKKAPHDAEPPEPPEPTTETPEELLASVSLTIENSVTRWEELVKDAKSPWS
jgi:restriction system protein